MADAEIKEKPQRAAYSLGAPTRGTGSSRYVFTAKWDFHKRLNDKSNPARCEGWHVHWTLSLYNAKTKKWKELKYERKSPKPERKEWGFNLNGFRLKENDGKLYTRSDFYPYTDWCLRYIRVSVCPYNRKGNGSWTSATRKIEQPRKPTIPTLSMREEDGNILLTVKANNGTDYREAARTDYWVGIKDSRTGKVVTEHRGSFNAGSSSGDTSHSYNSMDAYGRMGLAVGDHLKVTCYAWTRGLFGSSETATRALYISIPWMPKIGKVSFSSYGDSGRVRFWVTPNATEVHPVTGIKLQAIKDKPYTSAGQIPGADWDQCEDLAVDDAQCSALSTMVSNLRSSDGLYTWVRLKSWNISEAMFSRYSYARRIDELFRPEPSAKGDKVAIASVEPGDDGRSAKLVLAFDADGDTGTEISWSDDVHAWESAEQPKTFNVTWQEAKQNTVGTKTFVRQSVVYIPNLDEGKTYYFRARRYYKGEGDPTYGPYNAAAADTACTPATAPSSVTLVAQPFVPRGGDLLLSWTHDSDSEQARWEVITGETRTETDDAGKEHLYIRGDTDRRYKVVSVAGGDDARGGCVVKWDVLLEKLKGSASIPLAVRVSTGGEFVASEAYNVLVVDQPTLSVAANDLTARPLSLALACSSNARVTITCKSQGVGGDSPTGMSYQEYGDAVWSDELLPEWEADEEGVYTCSLTVPETVELWDGGRYTVTARAADTETGMKSEEATCEFAVDYSRKSPGPPDGVTVTPYDETDADTGWRTLGCRIALAPPDYNLGEFFSHPFSDRDYWNYVMPNVGTMEYLGDGWVHCELDNSSGTSLVFQNHMVKRLNESLKEGETYTFLIETRNVSYTGVCDILATHQFESQPHQFDRSARLVVGGESETVHVTVKARDSFDGCTLFTRGYLQVSAGGSFSGDIRVSLYEGEYDGEYVAPSTAEQIAGDTYDVYRLTLDGADLVAAGVAPGTVVNDTFAPFGGDGVPLAYRVAVRTADGCVDNWQDYTYELEGYELRIDWDGGYVELPYDLVVSGQWHKPFGRTGFFGGSQEGFWEDGGVEHDGGLSTDVIKLKDQDRIEAVFRLADHCGPCLVRTPDGRCYDANVDVRSYRWSFDDGAVPVSFDVKRIDLTEEHMASLPEPDESDPSEGDPDEGDES